MTKRLITAVVLSVVILLGYNLLISVVYKKKAVPGQTEVQTGGDTVAAQKNAVPPALVAEEPARAGKSIPASGKDLVVETKLCQAVFAPNGTIKHWRLKDFAQKNGQYVDLAEGTDTRAIDYACRVRPLKDKKGVVLTTESEGVRVTKEITFEETRYVSVMRFRIENNSPAVKTVSLFRWGPRIAGSADPSQLFFISCLKGKTTKHAAGKIKATIELKDAEWAAITEKYFAVVAIPRTKGQSLIIEKKENGAAVECRLEDMEPGTVATGELDIYALPKSYELLKKEGKNLPLLIKFGFIAQGIFYLLKLFYGFTQNYGVTIILLSILIKIALFPLSYKGTKSMQQMQRLQPQLEMLKQRFKHDKEALNRETMEMYKRMKINPLGGCLPLLLQMPVFFALYEVLQNSFELRHAPFIFWIKDLSVQDPYYILPILMGVTTFIQQKLTPSSAQQTQGMSYFMTIFLTFIFLTFPAGLVLYWLINNILSIGEQYLIKTRA